MRCQLSIVFFLAAAVAALPALAQEPPRQGRNRDDQAAPQVGQPAPLFKLKSLDGQAETELAEFQGKRPVVLIFGSYT